MVHQTNHLLHLQYKTTPYFLFVFFSTICSYNFHWYLTGTAENEKLRVRWTRDHKRLHFTFFVIGLAGAAMLVLPFLKHWFWMGGAILLTFLYSAPKIDRPPFYFLRKIAVGKTMFLAFVWMYVTTLLPIIFSGKAWQTQDVLFCTSRFFMVYSICVIFDYRDRQSDKLQGIRSLITFLDEKGVAIVFYASLLIFAMSTLALHFSGFSLPVTLLLLVPGVITLALYDYARTHFSDYLYYVVLDGLMMLSAIFTSFISI
jgi:4-hydroxybenzoate polyprenyltransferase